MIWMWEETKLWNEKWIAIIGRKNYLIVVYVFVCVEWMWWKDKNSQYHVFLLFALRVHWVVVGRTKIDAVHFHIVIFIECSCFASIY